MEKVTKERDEMQHKHETAMFERQQKAGLKAAHLEKKVAILTEEIEKREAQVAEIMIAANLDSNAVTQVRQSAAADQS